MENSCEFNDDGGALTSTSCNSETMCKEESCLEVFDSDYKDAILDLCSEFEKLSLHDDEAKSLSSKPNDDNGEDLLRKSDDNSVENSSNNSDDNYSEDSSSSDSDEDNDTAIERQENIMDIHHVYDYIQSVFANSSSFGDKKFITKEKSEAISEVDEESDPICIDMIVSSEEYLSIQDNLVHAKLYKDYLYRESLKKNPRREKNTLFDVLPTIEEESTPLMDDTPIESEDEMNIQDHMIVSHESMSSVEDEPIISKMKRPKRRLKTFRKWLARTFCCCCTTKNPP